MTNEMHNAHPLPPMDAKPGEGGNTAGPWEWQVHDHSMASLGNGESPGYGTPLVMSVGPCTACAKRREESGWEWGVCGTPSAANARLIAAAPDLLEALVLAEDVLSRSPFSTQMWPDGTHPNTGIELVRAAIARATQDTRHDR